MHMWVGTKKVGYNSVSAPERSHTCQVLDRLHFLSLNLCPQLGCLGGEAGPVTWATVGSHMTSDYLSSYGIVYVFDLL